MAGIEKLKQRIIKNDELRANELLNEAQDKASKIIDEAAKKAEIILEQAKKRAEKDGEDRKDRMTSRAVLDARNMVLQSKQDMIDKIFILAKQRIDKMDKAQYTDFIENMILKSVEDGDEEIIFSEADLNRIDEALVDRVNKKLISKGKKGMLKISSEKRAITSGFILKNGGVEINCSIDSKIRLMRDSLEGEIADLLFENEQS